MNKTWTSTFRVGIYKCTMTFSERHGVRSEWDPKLPGNLSDSQLQQYRAGRNALMDEIAKEIGGKVLVIET